MTTGSIAADRTVLRVSGPEARDFLQGLVTNDVRRLDDGPVYAALLSPQGKYLFDFFLVPDGDDVLIDVKADRAPALAQRLGMYRLRAKVAIEPTGLAVVVGFGAPPEGAFADPRAPGARLAGLRRGPGGVLAGMAPLDAGGDAGAARSRSACRRPASSSCPTTATSSRWASSGCTASTSARAATSARRSPRG